MPKRRREKELERKIKRYKRRLERWREENKDDSESASEQDRTAAAAAATAATSATPPTEELQERPILLEEEIKDTSALAQERETEGNFVFVLRILSLQYRHCLVSWRRVGFEKICKMSPI